MRICILVSNDMMSDPRVSRHADTLGRIGLKVVVVCPRSVYTPPAEQRAFYRVQRFDDLYMRMGIAKRVSRPPFGGASSPGSPLRHPPILRRLLTLIRLAIRLTIHEIYFTWQLWRAGRKFNAHVYLTNDLDTLLAGVLCSVGPRVLIHDAHELWPDQYVGMGTYPSAAIAWFRILEGLLLKHADAVITVNEFIAEVLQERYNIRRPYTVLNIPAKHPASRVLLRRASSNRRKTALYQGVYIMQRGLENLVRACEFLEDDVELVLRGYGSIEHELRQAAREFNNCRFETPVKVDELVTAASTEDIGVVTYLPVNMNNFLASPNKVFEYIQAGLPVVGSDIPFLRKVILENKIGCVFDPRNPRDIARAINLATRDDVLPVLRANVLRTQGQYSWDKEKEKLIDAVHTAASRLGRDGTVQVA